jgi:hypothetical protein
MTRIRCTSSLIWAKRTGCQKKKAGELLTFCCERVVGLGEECGWFVTLLQLG